MKKKLALLLLAFALLLAGCQETPESPVVIEKNQEMMIEVAQKGNETSSLISDFEVPEKFSGDWSGVDNCVVVHADANITLPDEACAPTAKIERRSFSQADADRMLEVFLDGNTLYQEQGVTRQKAQERLEHYQAIQRGEIPWEHDGTIDELPRLIEYYAELARTSPDESERSPASTVFQAYDGLYDERIEGYAQLERGTAHISIGNGAMRHDAVFYMDGYGDINRCNTLYVEQLPEEIEMDMTAEAALEMGNALIASVGNGSFVCDQIKAVAYAEYENEQYIGYFDSGYEMEFVRTVEGFPIAHCPKYEMPPEGGKYLVGAFAGTATPENETYAETWGYERITVHVNKDGVVYFAWSNPYSEPEIQTVDSQLMSFSDISDIFAKMIIVKNSELKVINERNGFVVIRDMDIDNVRLSLMRIRSKDNLDQGLLVPVWDFWGTECSYPEDESYRDLVYNGKYYSVMLTVNAIDGTIIDRELGY